MNSPRRRRLPSRQIFPAGESPLTSLPFVNSPRETIATDQEIQPAASPDPSIPSPRSPPPPPYYQDHDMHHLTSLRSRRSSTFLPISPDRGRRESVVVNTEDLGALDVEGTSFAALCRDPSLTITHNASFTGPSLPQPLSPRESLTLANGAPYLTA
eukprot:NODE_3074_length_821_cov_25.080311_g2557_i0.p1 GENE.NODE_3074_length_821_cov_25.080311_g2557_i0~~NODE_3074_length_821_cov_25.080311_g2557_i0.p1  ORF type:complete len:156 (+),score=12.95 NODE_3074_length_821_cov_25.080311_g2557_i0:268-735(+)